MKYVIHKNRHYTPQRYLVLPLNFKKTLTRKVTFSYPCWYKKINNDSMDYNKLFGMGTFDNHITSGRLAWRPDFERPGYINIYTYVYENQARLKSYKIGSVKTGDENIMSVGMVDNGYIFKVNGNSRLIKCERPRGYMRQHPYFGGDNEAPHDMYIILNRT